MATRGRKISILALMASVVTVSVALLMMLWGSIQGLRPPGDGQMTGDDLDQIAALEERLSSVESSIQRFLGNRGAGSFDPGLQAIESRLTRLEEMVRGMDNGPAPKEVEDEVDEESARLLKEAEDLLADLEKKRKIREGLSGLRNMLGENLKRMEEEEARRWITTSLGEMIDIGGRGLIGEPWVARSYLARRGTAEAAVIIQQQIQRVDLDSSIRVHYMDLFTKHFDVEKYPGFSTLALDFSRQDGDPELRAGAFEVLARLPGAIGRAEAIEALNQVGTDQGVARGAIRVLAAKGIRVDIPLIQKAAEEIGGIRVEIAAESATEAINERVGSQ